MREFFKGWKRKVGWITLGVACAYLTGWVASYLFPGEMRLFDAMLSSNFGTIYLVVFLSPSGYTEHLWYCSIDYWHVVLPLTLLSAWLLLSKPRQAKTKVG